MGQRRQGSFRARVGQLVHCRPFEFFIAATIALNAVYIGVETDLSPGGERLAWHVMDVIFVLVFLAELCLRIIAAASIREFTSDGWNVFDFVLVLASFTDVAEASAKSELHAVSTFRIVRLGRIVRLFRLVRFFPVIQDLVRGIVEASWTLLWTWILLAMLVYIFGIFSTRVIGQSLAEQLDPDVDAWFGTVPRSMFTLFQITTTEGWAHIARRIMHYYPVSAAFFVLYLYVTTFAVMNVVVAVIVENTLDQAADHRAQLAEKTEAAQWEACAQLYETFRAADQDGDGVLTEVEFSEYLQNKDVGNCLLQLGFDSRQAEGLFGILDYDGSGSLDADEFVGGIMKARDDARAKDIIMLECESMQAKRNARQKMRALARVVRTEVRALEQVMHDMRRDVLSVVRAVNAEPAAKLGVASLPRESFESESAPAPLARSGLARVFEHMDFEDTCPAASTVPLRSVLPCSLARRDRPPEEQPVRPSSSFPSASSPTSATAKRRSVLSFLENPPSQASSSAGEGRRGQRSRTLSDERKVHGDRD